MHIGLDLDNTLALYDRVFHRRAVAAGLVAPGTPARKRAVRDAIRALPGGERRWTELQGEVYGRLMPEAELAPGAGDFLVACRAAGARVSVISHKTEYPALGERVSLRAAARAWLEARGFPARFGVVAADVLFADTRAEKVALVGDRGCTHYVDDLVEVLARPDFPPAVARVLYDPGGTAAPPAGVRACRSWGEIGALLLGAAP